MKLSIIICVYNTKGELFEECLNSIKESSLFYSNAGHSTEIIVIDDGSDIDYGDLIKKYNIKYRKTENQGIFRARALGVSLASGEYITFVDSDDSVSFNYHAPMIEKMDKDGADIVIGDWAYHTDSSRYYTYADSTITTENMRLTNDEAITAFLSQEGREHSYYVLWNKLYRRKLLIDAVKSAMLDAENIDKYNYSEDALINFYAFLNAKLVVNLHTGYYFYRIHSSQSVNALSCEKLKSQITFMSHTLDKMESASQNHPKVNALKEHTSKWREFMSRAHFTRAKSGSFRSLYPYIKEKYCVERLRKSTYRDEICGMRCTPLPDNFTEIDKALFSAWKARCLPTLPKHTIDYVLRTRNYFFSRGIEEKGRAQKVPEPKIPLIKKLRFNPTLMRGARVIFPKGSKIRSFLKKHM